MWCTRCNLETNDNFCPVCGSQTVEDVPVKVYWCGECAIPIAHPVTAANKDICPICGRKTRYLTVDLRPVFPEERLLIALFLGKEAGQFMNRSVWATGSRYYIDGKPLSISVQAFAEADAEKISERIIASQEIIDYTFYDKNIRLFIQANQHRLAYLKDEAFSFIQRAVKGYGEENIVISFSGGKDSTVTADIVTKALSNPSLVHIFGDTTLEFPTTIEYANRYRTAHPLAIFQIAKNDEQVFYDVCNDIGPPARMMRWCCSMFKTGPIARVINSMYRSQQVLTFYGIRKTESVSRSKYNRIESDAESIKIQQQTVASPIFFWKDIDIWLYILSEGIDFNAAYRIGYDRVGCWCCPNNNQRAQFLSRIYMPEESKKWRKFLIDFAKKIGKPDPEVYVDSEKWKARQGGERSPVRWRCENSLHFCAFIEVAYMTNRIPWDIYESALILDTYLRIERGEIAFREAVSQLSEILRKKAINAGIEIDHTYRNKNGIAKQLGCMKYVVTDGKYGFSHTSKMYYEIVHIYKTDHERYVQILSQAQHMIE